MISKSKFALLGISLILGLASVRPASAVTVFADVQTADKLFDGIYDPVVEASGPFSVRFLADTEGVELFGFGMATSFNASLVQATNAQYGTDWTFSASQPAVDNTAGSIETLNNVGFTAPLVSGSAVPLYTVDFTPKGIGTFNLTNTPLGNQFVDGNGELATVTFSPTEIRAVPLPAAVWLLLSSIAGLTWIVRRPAQS